MVYAQLGDTHGAAEAFRHTLLDFAEIFLFLVVAMTYVNTMEERGVFNALSVWLVNAASHREPLLGDRRAGVRDLSVRRQPDHRAGDGRGRDRVGRAAAGSWPWLHQHRRGGQRRRRVQPVRGHHHADGLAEGPDPVHQISSPLFLPSLINWLVPAALMTFAFNAGVPTRRRRRHDLSRGALQVVGLFIGTIALTVLLHNFSHLPPVAGMMFGLGILKLYSYGLNLLRTPQHHRQRARRRLREPIFGAAMLEPQMAPQRPRPLQR